MKIQAQSSRSSGTAEERRRCWRWQRRIQGLVSASFGDNRWRWQDTTHAEKSSAGRQKAARTALNWIVDAGECWQGKPGCFRAQDAFSFERPFRWWIILCADVDTQQTLPPLRSLLSSPPTRLRVVQMRPSCSAASSRTSHPSSMPGMNALHPSPSSTAFPTGSLYSTDKKASAICCDRSASMSLWAVKQQ